MISILQFNVKTKGDYITPKNSSITYNPTENSEYNKNNKIKDDKNIETKELSKELSKDTIYITPNIKITTNDIKDFITKSPDKKIKNMKDYKQLFVSIDLFKQFIEHLNNKDEIGSLTLKNAVDYKKNDYSNKKNIETLKTLTDDLEKNKKEIEKTEENKKELLDNFIISTKNNNKSLEKENIKYHSDISNLIDSGLSETDFNASKNNIEKQIVENHLNIIKNYYNLIKVSELFNEVRNKKILEKKKMIDEKNDIIKDSKNRIKQIETYKRDKIKIDAIKVKITDNENEIYKLTTEI